MIVADVFIIFVNSFFCAVYGWERNVARFQFTRRIFLITINSSNPLVSFVIIFWYGLDFVLQQKKN